MNWQWQSLGDKSRSTTHGCVVQQLLPLLLEGKMCYNYTLYRARYLFPVRPYTARSLGQNALNRWQKLEYHGIL